MNQLATVVRPFSRGMVIPIAPGATTLGLIRFHILVRLSEPLIEWCNAQHWAVKTLLLAIILSLVATAIIA
jgi:hypothetical protein